jgi:hypothetical protein
MATTRKASGGSKRSRTPKGEGGKGARTTRARVVAEPMDEELVAEPIAEEPFEPEPAPEPEAMPVTVIPEPSFAARVRPPEAVAPPPPNRRAVFFDVENTSRPEHVDSVLRHLALDRFSVRLDLIAVGNWRVIGHETARILAERGAQCVHSAPSVGVRDWSDLRIAVAAGVWLAQARPGDVIDIISDDQAFDAVGDVAASLGVAFRRLSYRRMAGISRDMPVAEEPASAPRGRRSRRGGRRRRGGGGGRSAPGPLAPPSQVAAPAYASANGGGAEADEPHTAPHDEIITVVRQLMATLPPGRDVNIDNLSNALKARGFSRPPGSPRLITRLRRIKELDVSRTGVIKLRPDAAPFEAGAAADAPSSLEEPMTPGDDEAEPSPAAEGEGAAAPRPRRRRRRGGRRRRGRGGGASAVATT